MVISLKNLRMSYENRKRVLNNISFEVGQGEVIGYIGPNGAGKSTTIKLLLGMIKDYEGSIEVFDRNIRDCQEYKKRIGYVPEVTELYDALSPADYFQFFGGIYGLKEGMIKEKSLKLMEIFGIEDSYNKKISSLSKGMKQKVMIITSILHNPDLIIFDEPLSGLDANSVMIFKELLKELSINGKTILYSSHLMDVVEKISHRIVMIKEGEIIANNTFAELKESNNDLNLEELFTKLTGHSDFNNNAKKIVEVISGDDYASN